MNELSCSEFKIEHLSPEDLSVLQAHYLIIYKLFTSPRASDRDLAYGIMINHGVAFIKLMEENTYDWMYSQIGVELLKAARKARSAFFRYEERL